MAPGSPLLAELVEALCCMPGIGKKSAQRIAYHLLQRNREGARRLSEALAAASKQINHCERCRSFSESRHCTLCSSGQRDQALLCVVESPADVPVIEESGYRGSYFVLMGHLSPLDGVGPSELGLEALAERVRQEPVVEVILATNATVEGEATAHYIREMLAGIAGQRVRTTRIAQGVPAGGELEYLDAHTLARAFTDRRAL